MARETAPMAKIAADDGGGGGCLLRRSADMRVFYLVESLVAQPKPTSFSYIPNKSVMLSILCCVLFVYCKTTPIPSGLLVRFGKHSQSKHYYVGFNARPSQYQTLSPLHHFHFFFLKKPLFTKLCKNYITSLQRSSSKSPIIINSLVRIVLKKFEIEFDKKKKK